MGRWIKDVMGRGMSRRDFMMAAGTAALALGTMWCVMATGPSTLSGGCRAS